MNKFLMTTAVGVTLLTISSLSIAADTTTSTTTNTSTTVNSVTAVSTGFKASDIIKADIKSKAGVTIGAMQDIIIDREGMVVGVVADVGDFLGVEQRDVLLEWKSLSIQPSGDTVSVTTDLDKKAIAQKPPYKVVSR